VGFVCADDVWTGYACPAPICPEGGIAFMRDILAHSVYFQAATSKPKQVSAVRLGGMDAILAGPRTAPDA